MVHRRSRVSGLSLSACAAAACLLQAEPGWAQQSLDQAFADGFSLLRFEPSPAGDRFFVVPEGAVPEGDMGLRAQALGHYTLQPSLVRTDNVTGQDRELVSKQFFLHAGLSYVPTDWMHLHLDWPFALSQSGEGPNAPESPAVADPRVGVRFGLVGGEHSAFALAPGLDFWVPVGSQPNLVGDGAVRVTPRINISGEALKLFSTPRISKFPLSVFHATSPFTARCDVMGKSRPPATRKANVLGNEIGTSANRALLRNE